MFKGQKVGPWGRDQDWRQGREWRRKEGTGRWPEVDKWWFSEIRSGSQGAWSRVWRALGTWPASLTVTFLKRLPACGPEVPFSQHHLPTYQAPEGGGAGGGRPFTLLPLQ